MQAHSGRLSEPIEKSSVILLGIAEELSNLAESNYLTSSVESEKFQDKDKLLENTIKDFNFEYGIDSESFKSEIDEEKRKSLDLEIKVFNDELDDRTKNFITTIAFQATIDKLFSIYLIDPTEAASEICEFKSQKISLKELELYNRLSILLDFQIHLIVNSYPAVKSMYYSCLSQILEVLLNKSTESLETFWYYMESRSQIMQDKIFDQNAIGDRISVLEICNKLTDNFSEKKLQGKSDSYKKDTFNDIFQYRVRSFISNVFAFEDNTGLNKYFLISNRVVNEVPPASRYKNSGDFLKDVIQLHKLFNDPYFYLKSSNYKLTQKMADTLRNVYQYLIEDELSWASKTPKTDQFLVKSARSESEIKYLSTKYSDKTYFPENYWISPFENSRKGGLYDELKQNDLDVFHNQLKISKFRQIYLLQIYIISNLFYELNSSNKKDFLKSINAPANVKHFTDDSPPDNLINLFYKIKRELPKKFKDIDNQFSFLLQHLAITEIFWWGWLIYGKDSTTGKPLFQNRILAHAELLSVQEKSKTVILMKEKRYFNLYATPQLSRKMKVETGLEKLKSVDKNLTSYEHQISALNEKLESTESSEDRISLVEERNILTWKKLKRERSTNWLNFGNLLQKSMLTDEPTRKSITDAATSISAKLEFSNDISTKRKLETNSEFDLKESPDPKRSKT